MMGFDYTEAEADPSGIYIFRYNVSEKALKDMQYWAALYYNNNLFVPPKKFLDTYKTLKFMIYNEKTDS